MSVLGSVALFTGALVLASPGASGQGIDLPRDMSAPKAASGADSNDAQALYQWGVACYQAGRRTEARSLFAAAVHTDPQFALAYVALAQLQALGRVIVLVPGRGQVIVPRTETGDSASLLLRRAFQLNPFIEIHAPAVTELPMFWRGTLQLALHYYHDGNLPSALDAFGSVISRTSKPGHPEAIPPVALWYHILTAVQLGRYDDAIRDGWALLQAAQRSSEEGHDGGDLRVRDAEYILADLNRVAGRASEAEGLYQQVIEDDLSFYMAHARLAELYQSQGRWDQAIAERRRAIDANPEDPSLVFDLGVTLAGAGLDSAAELALREASRANPRETRAAYHLGLVEARLGKVEDARAEFNRFLAGAPSRYSWMRDDARLHLASLQ